MFVRNWMSAAAIVVPAVVPTSAALGRMENRLCISCKSREEAA